MISIPDTSLLTRKHLILRVAIVAVAAAGAGWAVASGGWVLGLAILAALGLIALAFFGPFAILMVVFCIGPFVSGWVIDLGPGIPDLSVERVLLVFAVGVLGVNFLTGRQKIPSLGLEDVCLIAFVIWGFMSILIRQGHNLPSQLFDLGSYLLPLFAYAVARSTIVSKRQITVLMVAAVLLLLILCVVVPAEFLTGTSIVGARSEVVASAVRAQSFLRSAWEFGTVAGMLMGLSLYSLGSYMPKPVRILATLAILFGIAAIGLSFMRGAWLGALAVIAILLLQRRGLRVLGVLVLIFSVVLGILYFPTIVESDLWIGRVAETRNLLGRVLLLRQQWSLFLQNPLLGSGLGVVTSTTFEFSPVSIAISHNMYLGHLVTFGLPGCTYFAAIVLILVKSIDTFRRLSRERSIGKELIAAMWAAAAAFFISAATLETSLFIYINILFWIVLGALAAVRANLTIGRGE